MKISTTSIFSTSYPNNTAKGGDVRHEETCQATNVKAVLTVEQESTCACGHRPARVDSAPSSSVTARKGAARKRPKPMPPRNPKPTHGPKFVLPSVKITISVAALVAIGAVLVGWKEPAPHEPGPKSRDPDPPAIIAPAPVKPPPAIVPKPSRKSRTNTIDVDDAPQQVSDRGSCSVCPPERIFQDPLYFHHFAPLGEPVSREGKVPEGKPADAKPAPAPEGKTPEAKPAPAPEAKPAPAPEAKPADAKPAPAPEGKTPEGKTPEARSVESKSQTSGDAGDAR